LRDIGGDASVNSLLFAPIFVNGDRAAVAVDLARPVAHAHTHGKSLVMDVYVTWNIKLIENDPEYDPGFDAGYTQKHVDRCSEIIDGFLASLEKTPEARKNEYILAAVKNTILRLNELNKECGGRLIETGQRDTLGTLIDLAARHAGLESSVDDVTYEWREW
jgi:hypothetical protein